MLARGMRCWMASALCLLKLQAKRVLHQVFEPQQHPPGRLSVYVHAAALCRMKDITDASHCAFGNDPAPMGNCSGALHTV